jgi:Fe-S-cluster-containing dehydrogenase component
MCFHRTDAGLVPACAAACLTGAIVYVRDFQANGGPAPAGFAPRRHTNPNINFVLQ